MDLFLWLIDIELIIINDERPQCSYSMLEGQVLEHALMLSKIEVLSARARHRAPNARALLIIDYNCSLVVLNFWN